MGGITIKHGESYTPIYKVWTAMKQRCSNPRSNEYYLYGARGITVCERWENSFENFRDDMGPRPVGFSIERKNNDGNYEPSNCIWASRKTQQKNMRSNKVVCYFGEKMKLLDAFNRSQCKLLYETVWTRVNRGWDVERALSEPLGTTFGPRKYSAGRWKNENTCAQKS